MGKNQSHHHLRDSLPLQHRHPELPPRHGPLHASLCPVDQVYVYRTWFFVAVSVTLLTLYPSPPPSVFRSQGVFRHGRWGAGSWGGEKQGWVDKSRQRDGRRCDVRRTDGAGCRGAADEARVAPVGKARYFFVLLTRNKQKILNTVEFYFFLLSSLLLWEKRKERGGMTGGKENRKDVIFSEKWEYVGKNNQRGKRMFSLERDWLCPL